jgi:hypothetical protein
MQYALVEYLHLVILPKPNVNSSIIISYLNDEIEIFGISLSASSNIALMYFPL